MKTAEWNTQTPVYKLVEDKIQLAALLEELGIDFCCGGKKTLEEACREHQLDPEEVLDRLRNASTETSSEETSLAEDLTPTEMVDHLEQTHHVYLKSALPHLTEVIEKVVNAHGSNHPELHELKTTYADLRSDLEPHLMKEEQVLFPMIRKLEAEGQDVEFHCGSIANPIRVMEMEHDRAGALMEQIKTLTGNFTAPEDGCGTYRLMMEELKTLVRDTHVHIHKENNLLFPEVLA